MIELKGSRFTQILPENLSSQTRTQALAYAVGRQVDKLLALADRMVIWADLDRVPEELLDCLAVELRTPAYSQDYPVETKRTLVRESLLFYARMGTPAAVDRATSTTPIRTGDAVSLTVEYRSDLDGGLEEGFSINEYGLFARTADSAETLIFYGCLGDHPQWVSPAAPGVAPDIRDYPVTIQISSEVNVQINYHADAFITPCCAAWWRGPPAALWRWPRTSRRWPARTGPSTARLGLISPARRRRSWDWRCDGWRPDMFGTSITDSLILIMQKPRCL